FFLTRHHYLSHRNRRKPWRPTSPTIRACRVPVLRRYLSRHVIRAAGGHPHWIVAPPQSQQPSVGSGNCEQIRDDLTDLHELIQAGGLGDEFGNSEAIEQDLVSPGVGRTPHAHWNAAEVAGVSDLAQYVFARILGQVQVHQDQVWNCGARIGALPANEGEGFVPVQQVNQFKPEILLLQRPIEKEDVGAVVFNDQNPGCGNNRRAFQPHYLRHPLFIISQLTSPAPARESARLLRRTAWAQLRYRKRDNKSPASTGFQMWA